jgi:hypothetical protein
MIRHISSLLTLFSLVAFLPAVAFADAAGERLESIREGARGLRADAARAVRAAAESGTAWSRTALYAERGDLLSPSTLEFLRERQAAAADSLERRLLVTLELDLARWYLEAAVASIDDRIAGLGESLKADVEDVGNSLTLNELNGRIPVEADTVHCRMLEAARAGLWGAHIDPLLDRRIAIQDSLARALGYEHHTALASRVQGVADVREVVAQLLLFTRATEPMFRILSGEFTGVPERRASIGRIDLTMMKVRALAARTEYDAMFRGFEAELLARATYDLGLEMTTPPPAVGLAAPPGFADLTRETPAGLVPGLVTGWREFGEARHRELADEARAEFREAGDGAIPAATGELLAGLLATPAWLQQWRESSSVAGRDEPARWGDPSIARYVRWRIWCELTRIRIDLAAGLLHDLVSHDAGEEVWGLFFLVPPDSNSAPRWRRLLEDAHGFPVTADDAWDHALRGRNHLAAAIEVRALGLAAAVEEALVLAHGEDWFRKPGARQALREGLFRVSAATDADAVARAFGDAELNLEALRRRYERLFEWTETAGFGQRR